MLSRCAHFLLRNNRNAAFVAFLCSIFPVFLGSISVIIVGLVTVHKKAKDGFFVLAWGVLPILAQAYVSKSYAVLLTAVLAFFLVWLMAIVLCRSGSWGRLLELAMMLSVVAVICAFLAFEADIEQWWLAHISEYMHRLLDQGMIQTDQALSQDQVLFLAQLSTGVEALLLFLFAGLKLLIARWWEARVFKTGALRPALLKTRLSAWTLLLLVFLSGAAFFSQKMMFISALIPVGGFYAIAGLAILHTWLQGYKYATMALFGFYIVMILFPYIIALPLLMGLADSGLDLRKFIKKEV